VWPKPGKESLVNVDRAVLVAIYHQAAVLILTAIRPLPQWHALLALTHVARLGGIALIDYRTFFPKTQTLVEGNLSPSRSEAKPFQAGQTCTVWSEEAEAMKTPVGDQATALI
jgi:hypothetical protein